MNCFIFTKHRSFLFVPSLISSLSAPGQLFALAYKTGARFSF